MPHTAEPRLPAAEEIVEISDRFGRLDELVFRTVRNLEALHKQWMEAKDASEDGETTYADVGRLAVFADDLELEAGELTRYSTRIREGMHETMMRVRETKAVAA